MIKQIATIKTKTQALDYNRGLAKARHIQYRLQKHLPPPDRPLTGIMWSPMTPGPYVVPVLRWIE